MEKISLILNKNLILESGQKMSIKSFLRALSSTGRTGTKYSDILELVPVLKPGLMLRSFSAKCKSQDY